MGELRIDSTRTLNNGVAIPLLGLGVFRAENGRETERAVLWALEAGYRHIDTAAAYGNEESVGRAIRESGIPRSEIFLTTKLWNEDSRRGTEVEAFNRSLDLLGTDYVDLYLVHWPVPGRFEKSYVALEPLYRAGHIKALGASNFHRHHLEALANVTDVAPAVDQVECHPLLSQKPLVDYCEGLGIAVTCWSPLGGVRLNLTADPALAGIGAKYGKTAAQVIIRWELQRGLVTIPKSVRRERIAENAGVFDFELSHADMLAIGDMNRNQRAGSDPDNFDF